MVFYYIVRRATGGLLTVTTQSGSGTLAGNAHSDSFARLCAATARSISAAINRQFLRPALQAAYPHSPILVSFELAPEPVDDRLQMAQLLGAVNSAGFRPSAETVSELMNFEVQPVQEAMPGQTPVVNRRGLPAAAGNENISGSGVARPSETPGLGGVVANASNDLTRDDAADLSRRSGEAAEAEPPLNAGELAALRALGGELNPAQVAEDAEYMAGEMLAGLREPVANTRSLLDSFLAEGEAAPITNECTVDNDPQRCRCDPSTWKPITVPPLIKPEEARARLQKGIKVKNPLGEDVKLNNKLLSHWEEGKKDVQLINDRLAALPFIEEVVKNPAEIWQNENGSRTYLAASFDPYQEASRRYVVAFTTSSDNTVLETYHLNSTSISGKRKGKLIYEAGRADAPGT